MTEFEKASTTALRWKTEAARPDGNLVLRLRLGAMAGHMQSDLPATRRGALIDILADGRPHSRQDLIDRLETEIGETCWGTRPHEALIRDIAALRRGGIRVAYSRRPSLEGYYLEYPALVGESGAAAGSLDDKLWRESITKMTVAQKNIASFAAAEFALRQKRAIARLEHPEWPDEQIDEMARRLVFGELDNG